ncbi:encapsulin [Methanobacterium paludis]|uniref:Major capsid protein n=1 Tax=Methanobacterium paludis (strain DSM 25820 / JCM 18151 / SWAN1) TaxID=868131 RepID=F6D2R5_METPW|nr:encapsulin [Methanobacterium paludis]AEG18644.1 hypothetical protein MSWAN_1633 [Methanobacterium paludis]
MGYLPQAITNYYSTQVIKAYKAPLVGTFLLARGEDLPPGSATVTRDQVANFTGKAKRGFKLRTIPRENGERTPKTVQVVEHAYGFDMHRKSLDAYKREGTSALNGEDARQSGRIVAESLDDIIFNGDKNRGVKGIYEDAGLTPFVLADGKAWNQVGVPDDTIVEAVAELASTQLYTGMPMKLALDPLAFGQLSKRVPNTSATYLDFIAKIPQFQNGVNDIYATAALAAGTGLLEYFGVDIAERNVEEDINTFPVQGGVPDKGDMIYFNTETFQATDIHHFDAFLPLQNLFDTTP